MNTYFLDAQKAHRPQKSVRFCALFSSGIHRKKLYTRRRYGIIKVSKNQLYQRFQGFYNAAICFSVPPVRHGAALVRDQEAVGSNPVTRTKKNRNFDTTSIRVTVLFLLLKPLCHEALQTFAQRTKCHRGHTGVFVDRLNRPKIASLQYIHSHNDTYER